MDSFIAIVDWSSIFLGLTIPNFATSYSDHNGLILNTNGVVESWRRGSKPFRFEAMWLGANGCEDIIENSWQSSIHIEAM